MFDVVSNAFFIHLLPMKMNFNIVVFLILIFFVVSGRSFAFCTEKDSLKTAIVYPYNDSIHELHFKYADRKRGMKPFIAPTVLVAGGVALHFSDLKYDINDWRAEHFYYQGSVDDYLRFGPMVAVYSLNALGIKGKNNFGNESALLFKSVLLNTLVVRILKDATHVERPWGHTFDSFPSGHTSLVFAMAQWMHHEYGDRSVWYSIGAYSCATAVGVMRVSKGGHWASDVLAGAGIGMMSTELVYLTHLYKWDAAHIKNFDIFPFKLGNQTGVTLVYSF
jgi:membrane-associated phospholipid phosphatase